MNEKELSKLKRPELLQIIYLLKKKNEELTLEIQKLKENYGSSGISDEEIKKIAEAVAEKMKQEK